MTIEEFCSALAKVQQRTAADNALALLWWHDQQTVGAELREGELARIMRDNGLGSPKPSRLRASIIKSRRAILKPGGFQLKAASREEIRTELTPHLDMRPQVAHSTGYIPDGVWRNTRGYIENVAEQLNGCYACAFYDAAAVLLRKLVETLIIEAYEHERCESEIKADDGNYLMLSDLISRATGTSGLKLGRDAKRGLNEIKAIGDRAAHNRRFIARKGDLLKIEKEVRVTVDELINLADLRHAPKRGE